MKAHPLFPYILEKHLAIPTSPFHPVPFRRPLTFLILVGGIGAQGKWCQPGHHKLANKDLILVNTVQLKPMIKAHFSGKLVSSGISDVVIASLYSEKTSLKKLMKKIIIITNNTKTIY